MQYPELESLDFTSALLENFCHTQHHLVSGYTVMCVLEPVYLLDPGEIPHTDILLSPFSFISIASILTKHLLKAKEIRPQYV